jgi:hypothetical protein
VAEFISTVSERYQFKSSIMSDVFETDKNDWLVEIKSVVEAKGD